MNKQVYVPMDDSQMLNKYLESISNGKEYFIFKKKIYLNDTIKYEFGSYYYLTNIKVTKNSAFNDTKSTNVDDVEQKKHAKFYKKLEPKMLEKYLIAISNGKTFFSLNGKTHYHDRIVHKYGDYWILKPTYVCSNMIDQKNDLPHKNKAQEVIADTKHNNVEIYDSLIGPKAPVTISIQQEQQTERELELEQKRLESKLEQMEQEKTEYLRQWKQNLTELKTNIFKYLDQYKHMQNKSKYLQQYEQNLKELKIKKIEYLQQWQHQYSKQYQNLCLVYRKQENPNQDFSDLTQRNDAYRNDIDIDIREQLELFRCNNCKNEEHSCESCDRKCLRELEAEYL